MAADPRPDLGRPDLGRRADYRDFRPVTTRWMDNDVNGHVNNVHYLSYFDTAVTGWLVAGGMIGFSSGPMWMMAETGCRYHGEVSFPDLLAVGLRIGRLGASSVRWELALFREGMQTASAEGHLVHVHVDRDTRRPTPIPDDIRAVLALMQA